MGKERPSRNNRGRHTDRDDRELDRGSNSSDALIRNLADALKDDVTKD